MKPRVKVKVRFGKVARSVAPPDVERVPRVARLLALAWWIDEQVRAGEIGDLSAVARELRLSRARVSQVMNLALLAPEIQAAVLDRAGHTERALRRVVTTPVWSEQFCLGESKTSG